MRIRIPTPSTSTLADLFGAACIAAFAYFCWAPLALLVVGVAALLASRERVRRR